MSFLKLECYMSSIGSEGASLPWAHQSGTLRDGSSTCQLSHQLSLADWGAKITKSNPMRLGRRLHEIASSCRASVGAKASFAAAGNTTTTVLCSTLIQSHINLDSLSGS
jgi:hypothetical protein